MILKRGNNKKNNEKNIFLFDYNIETYVIVVIISIF